AWLHGPSGINHCRVGALSEGRLRPPFVLPVVMNRGIPSPSLSRATLTSPPMVTPGPGSTGYGRRSEPLDRGVRLPFLGSILIRLIGTDRGIGQRCPIDGGLGWQLTVQGREMSAATGERVGRLADGIPRERPRMIRPIRDGCP